ncbi:hypothetical protein [Acidovorax sp. NCPPB 3576]|uniref:hypothetical protein n=1 Tax=Acidovorax sp. NCPPB 3576 TaxID=2940488 RepID=UPI00234A6458|nr:hypothetical protein [Acidovorax sp. NCPPB 3576]WCM89474.1 hypothetical protein M5C98_05330 [Acidovorax sp. NCPPB 3576]
MALAQPSSVDPSLSPSPSQGDRAGAAPPVTMCQATVRAQAGLDAYSVACGAETLEAGVGVMLPALVPGDEVLLARTDAGRAVITAVLVPCAAVPWSDRSIRLQSHDSITLSSGAATLRLTAEGLARIVALTIEHDARDLVDIDAAEVRIN